MSTGKLTFAIHNIFSLASRERCMSNMKKISVPTFGQEPNSKAAVLVPLVRVDGTPSLLYTVRASSLRAASGEVAFPGGKAQPEEAPVQTALREIDEEIGLVPQKIDVWGAAPPVPGRDNTFMITPVLGSVNNLDKADLKINSQEVSEVFTVPIELLVDPKNQYHTQFKNGFVLPVFVADHYKIWGMTAYITHCFLSSILSKDVYRHDWLKKKVVVHNIT